MPMSPDTLKLLSKVDFLATLDPATLELLHEQMQSFDQ